MNNPVGRPMKYKRFLEVLGDEEIHTPATIVRTGEAKGLFGQLLTGEDLKKARLKVRHSLARFSSNHGFPKAGDGWVDLAGQPPQRGWFGKRWKRNAHKTAKQTKEEP